MKRLDLLPPHQLVELTHAIHELNATINKSRVISLILAKAARLSGCEGTCLVLFHKHDGEPPEVYPNGLSDAFAKRAPTYSTQPFRDDVAQKGSICFNHIPSDCKERIRSIFCCSLTPDGKQIGLLYFLDLINSTFSEDRTHLLQHFASYSALAIRNSLIIEKKETKIQQLNTINQTTFSLSTVSDTPSVIQGIVDQATSLIRSQTACLLMLHPGSNRIENVYQTGGMDNENLIFNSHLEERLYDTLKKHKAVNLTSRDLKSGEFSLPFSLPNMKNLLAFPLVRQKRLMGALILMNKTNASAYNKDDEQILRTYGIQAVFSIENARLHERTETLVTTDGLTELYNHREFQNRLQAEIRRSIRYKHPFTMLMIDIDHFKKINGTHGYEEGDKVLKEVAQTIRDSIRDIDIAARYGGEEFMVILPETPCERSLIVADRIRKKIFEKSFGNTQEDQAFKVTISMGISCFPDDSLNREELITKCDQALYFAKRNGRNCVRRYDETLIAFIENKEGKIAELLKDAKLKIMEELAAAVDAKNIYTRGHTDKVVQYAMHLAEVLQLDSDQIESLKIASLLHDIGTVSIPDNVLNKTGPLSEKERGIIQSHPQLGEMIIKRSTPLEHAAPAILHHHERYDGKGYPKGLAGEEIPLLARILSVAEAYQAMTSERPYRKKLSNGDAIAELKMNAGSQFDPEIVNAFVKTPPSSPPV